MTQLMTTLASLRKPVPIVLSAILALWTYLGLAVTRTGSAAGYLHDTPHILMSLGVIVVAWGGMLILVSILFWLLDRLSRGSGNTGTQPSKGLSLAVFAIVLVCWLPYLISCFPGLINFDYFNQLNQFVGARPLGNHHPVAMTFLFGVLYSIGHHFSGASGGLYLTVWVQALCLDGLFTYAHRWLCRMGVRRGVRVAVVIFCALCPLFPLYACVLVKDTLSATVLALFALQIAVRSWSEHNGSATPRMASLPAIAAVGSLATLTRANCVYLIAGTMFACLFTLKRTSKPRLLASLAIIVALYVGWTNVLLPAGEVIPSDTALVMSIPLEQTGAYALYSPDDATEEERSAIERLLGVDYEEVGNLYVPNIVDPLQAAARSGAEDHDRLLAYLRAWAAQGLRHPGIYLDAFLKANVGYWYPHIPFDQLQDLDYTQNTPASHLAWMRGLGYGFTGVLSDMDMAFSPFERGRATLQQLLKMLCDAPILGLVLQPAFYSWSCLTVGVWSAARHRSSSPLLVLLVLLFLTECVSPLAASLRYALPLVVLLPLLLGVSLGHERRPHGPLHRRS